MSGFFCPAERAPEFFCADATKNIFSPRVIDAARGALHPSFASNPTRSNQLWGGLVLHDIHTRALKRAAEILGGEDKLMIFLGASEHDYSAWVNQHELPRNIFLRLVDLITDDDVRRVAASASR